MTKSENVARRMKTAVQSNNFANGSEARLPGTMFAIVAALWFGLLGLSAPALAQDQPAAVTAPACGEEMSLLSQSGAPSLSFGTLATPGATDPEGTPAGRYMLFPDQEVLAFQPYLAGISAEELTTDQGGTNPPAASYTLDAWDPNGWGPTPYFPSAAHFLKPSSEDALWAARNGRPTDPQAGVDVTFFGGTDGGFFKTFSATLPGTLLPRQSGFTDFIAIAAGDLDNATGSDGNLHDKAVVARVNSEDPQFYGYDVDVVDYESGKIQSPAVAVSHFADIKPTFQTKPQTSISGLLPSDNILAVVTGDFLGTGKKEVALLTLGDNTLLLYTFQYESADGSHTLKLERAQYFVLPNVGPEPWRSRPIVGTIAATAGDFDGDGADELAVAYARWGESSTNKNYGGYGIGMLILKYDSSFNATLKNDTVMFTAGGLGDKTFPLSTRPIVDITSGQFVLDPPNGIPYGRKQIVLGWKDTGYAAGSSPKPANIQLQAYSVSSNLATVAPMGPKLTIGGDFFSSIRFSIAAGGFEGASGKLPIYQLAVNSWFGAGELGTFTELTTYRVSGAGISLWQRKPQQPTGVLADTRMRVPVIAYDGHGNSRYLGNPVHLTAYSSPTTDFIMQEPPKHAYWDERDHTLHNYSRFDGNYVHLFRGDTASFSTETKSESSRDTGGSAAISAGVTVTTGADFGIVKSGADVKIDVTEKGSYDYNEQKEWFNSQYKERTVASEGQTDRDDYLKGQMQSFDIWRYRVYGAPNGGSSLNAFYELVFPGQSITFDGGGMNFYWYQPIHENGNILSYPSRLGANGGSPYIPADIGSFTLPNGQTKQNEPVVPPSEQRFDATSGSILLEFSQDIAQSGSFTYSHKIGESFDARVIVTGEAKGFGGSGFQFRSCGSIEFHNSNSWGGNDTSTSTTKDQTKVVLNRARGNPTWAYPFFPVVYNTKDGTLKMSFGMPNPANASTNKSGYQTYAGLYGGLPDPALNLPLRFQSRSAGSGELELWEPNRETSRKKMRGLFFRQAQIDPAANTYLQWAFNPKPGDIVRIEPRVYNYSTAVTAFNTVVEFQVIQYDSGRDSEICDAPINGAPTKITGLVCPRSARTTIGKATISQLNPLQFTCISGYDDPAITGCARSVFLDWDTANFGPDFGTYDYRVYIVLNPGSRAGSEIYGQEPDPLNITNVENTTPMVVTAPGSDLETGDYVIIGDVQGLDKANGTFTVTRISNDQFELNGSVSSRGSYAGGGMVSVLDPGQNNEGYGTISITNIPALAAGADPVPHDYLEANSLEGLSEDVSSRLVDSALTAVQGEPLELRFTAYTTILHADGAHMLLFDGNPAEGNPAIADQVIHPGAHGSNGTSIWFTWTPTTSGQHHLYAALIEEPEQQLPAAELDVNVIAPQYR